MIHRALQYLRSRARTLTTLGALAALVLASAPVGAQDDTTRSLWDTQFVQKRPAKKAGSRTRPSARYRRARPSTATRPAAAVPADAAALVGVTIWRLRPAAATDTAVARILVHEETSGEGEWVPERVDVGTPLAEGQKVRLSVEVPTTGYLYVIDREQYADGTFSDPVLIFPTLRTRGGDNTVSAGSVLEIPAQTDDPVAFTVRRSRPDQVAELITLLVTPAPLENVKIARNASRLDAATVAAWEAEWGAAAERLEMVEGAGTPYSPAEKSAGGPAGTPLTQDDPPPQTIYRIAAKPGSPFLVSVPLEIR